MMGSVVASGLQKAEGLGSKESFDFLIQFLRKIGIITLFVGIAMAPLSIYILAAATTAKNNEIETLLNMRGVFSNIKTPAIHLTGLAPAPALSDNPVQSFFNFWGAAASDVSAIGSDLAAVGGALETVGADLANGFMDLAKVFYMATVHFPGLMWDGAVWTLGTAIGNILTFAFPYFILFGIISIAISILLIPVKWAVTSGYLPNRLAVRNKAFLRRWFQEPLDHILLSETIVRRAKEFNKVENEVAEIAMGEVPNELPALLQETRPPSLSEIEAKKEAEELKKLPEQPMNEREVLTRILHSGNFSLVSVFENDERTPPDIEEKNQKKAVKSAKKRGAVRVWETVGTDGQRGVLATGMTLLTTKHLAQEFGQKVFVFGKNIYSTMTGAIIEKYRYVLTDKEGAERERHRTKIPSANMEFALSNKPPIITTKEEATPGPAPSPPTQVPETKPKEEWDESVEEVPEDKTKEEWDESSE